MALAEKSSDARDRTRPGITQSHRGRRVRNWVIALALILFAFNTVSNSLRSGTAEAQAEATQPAEAVPVVGQDPVVEAAPANPFDVKRVAKLPVNFDSSPAKTSLLSTAETVAAEIGTFSSKQTPEEYLATLRYTDQEFKNELAKSLETTWPAIKSADITVRGERSGVEPVIRAFVADSNLAMVEVVVKQTVSYPDGTSRIQTRSYLLNLMGRESEDGNMAWIVGGFGKQ